ncbi:MAG TPA: hypothetical protein VK939_02585 [Longimicrobiales bacterium]|nr:hypothetical protein [Longimicrobiales bacterium]
MRISLLLLAAAFLCAATGSALTASALSAQVPERHDHAGGHGEALGVVEFENSGAAAAQPMFLRGLALLHSFEYDQAAESFRAAQLADPGFAMAYWGEALTYSHPLWGQDDPATARVALARLAPSRAARLARAGSARERAYGAAVEAYFMDADHATRARAFADSMRSVVAQYPDDVDAAAFAALAVMTFEYVGGVPAAARPALRTEAIDLAERVFRTSPRHPGGTHYLIHATDDPEYAPRGLEAARRYSEIAPDAEHALHMPSHIFLQLGMWDDVVASNERAWAASRADIRERGLPHSALSFHALQWLQYGYLQQGRYEAAAAVVDTARAVLAGLDLSGPYAVDARVATGWLEFAVAAHALERAGERPARWSGAVCASARAFVPAGPPRSERERFMQLGATYRAVVAAAACGDVAAPGHADDDVAGGVRTHLASLDPGSPDAAQLRLALAHADALAAIHRGDEAAAIALLEALPGGRPLVGPPGTLRTQELLGSALLRVGRALDAVAVFERSLQLTPGRVNSLLGLARASRAAGDGANAARAYGQLLAAWHAADVDAAIIAEAGAARP